MTGNADSNDAVCMRVAASSPGARYSRYAPPTLAAEVALTYVPSPIPIAIRNITGDRNELKIEPRHVRRYSRKLCSYAAPIDASLLIGGTRVRVCAPPIGAPGAPEGLAVGVAAVIRRGFGRSVGGTRPRGSTGERGRPPG